VNWIGSVRWRCSGEDIICGYRTANALEFKLANRLDSDGIFDRHQDTRADEYLTGLGFVAKARRDIGYRPNCGVVEPPLEADGAEWVLSGVKNPTTITTPDMYLDQKDAG
jgi:hypothetical protein